MATEGAGGLSTTAIERCIDNWETETQDDAEIPAAHAELAALVERAGRATTLAAALIDLGCAASRVAVLIPRVRRNDYDEAWARLDGALIAALPPYDGGPGVAGARDETITALTKVAQIVVDCRDLPAGEFRDRWGVVTWADYYDKLTALADAALDALRDGGAG